MYRGVQQCAHVHVCVCGVHTFTLMCCVNVCAYLWCVHVVDKCSWQWKLNL